LEKRRHSTPIKNNIQRRISSPMAEVKGDISDSEEEDFVELTREESKA
jgi:hypothetical protein